MSNPDIQTFAPCSNNFSPDSDSTGTASRCQIGLNRPRLLLAFVLLFAVSVVSGADATTPSSLTARERAEQLFLENRPEEALPEFQAALREEPERVQLYLQLAVVYEQLDRSAQATAILEQGLARNPEQAHVFYHNLAVQRIRESDLDEAESLLLSAVEQDPDFALPWRNLGNISVETGEYTEAIERYEQYFTRAPASPAREPVTEMIGYLNDLLLAEERRIEAERQARAEAERRRAELQEAVRRSLEESRREAERFGGGDEGFESVEEDFDIFD
jgi:tetratricopeptide (TPR) repeat protein